MTPEERGRFLVEAEALGLFVCPAGSWGELEVIRTRERQMQELIHNGGSLADLKRLRATWLPKRKVRR